MVKRRPVSGLIRISACELKYIIAILIQQAFLALAALGSSLVLSAQEPARTDFALLRAGEGNGTVAYRRFCGSLEASAELMALTERGQERIRTVMRDTREVISWGEPNEADAPRRMPTILAQMERRRAELHEMRSDLSRVDQLNNEHSEAIRAFHQTYPTYSLAILFFAASFFVILLVSTWHLCRAAVLGDRGRRTLPITVCAIIVAWTLAVLFGWSIADGSEYAAYSDVPVSSPSQIDTWAENVQEQAAVEAEFAALSGEIAEQRAALRSEFLSMRSVCPNANPHRLF